MKENENKYIIALDMDGTLLNSNHEISHDTLNYLKKLNKDGHHIIISSGRPIRGIKKYYDELELTGPAICYNGAYVYPGKEEKFPEFCFSFNQNIIKSIADEIYPYVDNIILETNTNLYMLHEDDSLDVFFTKALMNNILGDVRKTLHEDTMTMLIKVTNMEHNDLIQKAVDKHPEVKLRFWSGKWCEVSEIYYDYINKGNALTKIAEFYNIPPERIVAFGDACNDIELLKFAKYGIALSNAEDELKQVAKFVSQFSNDEDAIKKELEKIIK